MTPDTLIDRTPREIGHQSVPGLCELAAAGLADMFDAGSQLFCGTYRRSGGAMRAEGVSPRYTMMTLLGLHRYEKSGGRSPVATTQVLNGLLQDTSWLQGVGDLGLLLWTCAELAPERLPRLYRQIRADTALTRFADGLRGCTMEVAWYLTGLASCSLAGCVDIPGLHDQISAARQILERNCGAFGIYGHVRPSLSFKGYLRGRVGSFADQVYPTIAFARLSQALLDEKAQQMALRTARTMCKLQGRLGEWNWHYDAASGRVVSRYPIYSVHQHAMGPMMLFAASEAAGVDFSDQVFKGLDWISGNNEFSRDFIDPALSLIWRSIYLVPTDSFADAGLRFLQLRRGAADARQLQVCYECRPYELGWLLYAWAGR